jgi:hypothetical protein
MARGADVTFTVGWGLAGTIGFGRAVAGGALGATTAGEGGAVAGLGATFAAGGLGVSTTTFGSSTTGAAGGSKVAVVDAACGFSTGCGAATVSGAAGVTAAGSGGAGGGGTYPYSFSIDSAVILSTVLEWLLTG